MLVIDLPLGLLVCTDHKVYCNGYSRDFELNPDGILSFHRKLCVSIVIELKHVILTVAYSSPYAMYPGSIMMYRDL